MDYEKAYKAVLQTATQWIKDGCTDKEKICLESVFPELRESEDERIRKQLIDAIKIGRSNGGISFTEAAAEKYIAYLEKQKEQKSTEWSEEDEHNLEYVIDCVYDFYPDPVMKYKLKDWLKSIREKFKKEDKK